MKKNFLRSTVGAAIAVLCTQFATAQTNIFPNTGNAGINTLTPAQPLHVIGKTRFDVSATGAGAGRFYLTRPASTNYECILSFGTNGTSTYDWAMGTPFNASSASNDFIIAGWTPGRSFTILASNGNTSVGNISTPLTKFHVGGNAIFSTSATSPASAAYIRGNAGYSSATTPDYTFWNNDQAGIFHPATNVIGFSTNGAENMRIHSNGFVGIGATAPVEKLHVHDGAIKITGTNPNGGPMILFGGSPASAPYGEFGIEYAVGDHGMNFWKPFNSHNVAGSTIGATNYVMFINDDGNVGINTLASTLNASGYAYKLSVNGSIRAKEVVVETGWADFVFDKNYKLSSLKEVESFIAANGHLENIPTTAEVQKNGVALGQVETLLLQKIEEMTLYLIELDKKNEALEKEVSKLKNQ